MVQLHEKYKENFDVSSEGPSSGVTPDEVVANSSNYTDEGPSLETSFKFSLYIFQVVASLPTKLLLLALPTLAQAVTIVLN